MSTFNEAGNNVMVLEPPKSQIRRRKRGSHILPPIRNTRSKGYWWGSSIRYVHHIGVMTDSENRDYKILLCTDGDGEMGSFGNQTDELYSVNREHGCWGYSYLEGRLAWIEHNPLYALLREGTIPGKDRLFLAPSQFSSRPPTVQIKTEDLWDLVERARADPAIFYDHFEKLFRPKYGCQALDVASIRPEHRGCPILDLGRLRHLWKQRDAEADSYKPL